MNRNEFETWMKDKMQELPFSPKEDGWLKLQADLQKPATPHKKVFLLPWMKIAASVMAVVSIGVASRYIFKETDSKENSMVTDNKSVAPVTPQAERTESASIPKTTIASPKQNISTPHLLSSNNTKVNNNITSDTNQAIIIPEIAGTEVAPKKENTGTTPSVKKDYQSNNLNKYGEPYAADNNAYAQNKVNSQILHVGMNANIGSSTVSNIGYQVGVVGRGNISKIIFVEAGLSLASNTVNTNSQHTFSSTKYDGVGNETNAITTTTNVEADYARNIISVGFSPSIGVKISRNLSVSAGGAVNRNLNPSLKLTNGNSIESEAFSKDIISTSQTVTNWDVGITCNADYKVTRNLSFNVNYRKGISDYLQQNNKYLKNSGVQLGLKFLFGK